jgi:hypothetical protein
MTAPLLRVLVFANSSLLGAHGAVVVIQSSEARDLLLSRTANEHAMSCIFFVILSAAKDGLFGGSMTTDAASHRTL